MERNKWTGFKLKVYWVKETVAGDLILLLIKIVVISYLI